MFLKISSQSGIDLERATYISDPPLILYLSAFILDKCKFTKVQLLAHRSSFHKDYRQCHQQEVARQLWRSRSTGFITQWLPDTGRWPYSLHVQRRFPS